MENKQTNNNDKKNNNNFAQPSSFGGFKLWQKGWSTQNKECYHALDKEPKQWIISASCVLNP